MKIKVFNEKTNQEKKNLSFLKFQFFQKKKKIKNF